MNTLHSLFTKLPTSIQLRNLRVFDIGDSSILCRVNGILDKVSSRGLVTTKSVVRELDSYPPGIPKGPRKFLKYNDVIYPPSKLGDPIRPAEICHGRANIKYSTRKLWYIASMIRGMSIDEAVKQLSFSTRKGAMSILEVLEEAREMAVREFNVEFRSNLWIAHSFVGRGLTVNGFRRHKAERRGIISYRYTHYFVRLREGAPPKYYYKPEDTGYEKMEKHLQELRSRAIRGGL